jgi:hypothetical protein
MRLYILALGALTLVGCVTPQELAREDHDRCTGYGFQPGSETYAQCRMTLDTNRQASEQAAFMAYFACNSKDPQWPLPQCRRPLLSARPRVTNGAQATPDARHGKWPVRLSGTVYCHKHPCGT